MLIVKWRTAHANIMLHFETVAEDEATATLIWKSKFSEEIGSNAGPYMENLN